MDAPRRGPPRAAGLWRPPQGPGRTGAGRGTAGRSPRVPGAGYKIDFAYPDVLLAIEVDGYDPHGTRKAFDTDRARQNRLVLLGWTMLRFTWPQVVREPAKVAAEVRAALGALMRR
jgi:hypothetical protein